MSPENVKAGSIIWPYLDGPLAATRCEVTSTKRLRTAWVIYFLNPISNAGHWVDRRIFLLTDDVTAV